MTQTNPKKGLIEKKTCHITVQTTAKQVHRQLEMIEIIIDKDLKIISIIDSYFARIIDPKEEDRKIQEFKHRETCRSYIIDFIKKNDLTHLKIAQMSGPDSKIIGWFMNDGFHKVSDNKMNLIIKWYLRFLSNPTIFEKILIEFKSEKEKARTQIDKYLASIIDPKEEL